MTDSEIADKADFSRIRYAQCWEDADVLLEGLDIREGERCLSIASAGDNALAMLTRHPARVLAVDLNPAQLYCLELRVAAYTALDHPALLMLMGSRPCADRQPLYAACRPLLSPACAAFWDSLLPGLLRFGLGGVGKFERYFRLFKNFVLPLCHNRAEREALFTRRAPAQRTAFFDGVWQNRRWRLLSRCFFSSFVMGRLGRDPAFFAYQKGGMGEHVRRLIRHGLCDLDPADNPYLRWIVAGTHGETLPTALRPEHFAVIRANLPRLEWRLCSVETLTEDARRQGLTFHKFNLSDMFEYMAKPAFEAVLAGLLDVAEPGGRLLYWNMIVPRSAPDKLRGKLRSLQEEAARLHARDKAFFYSRLVIEEVS